MSEVRSERFVFPIAKRAWGVFGFFAVLLVVWLGRDWIAKSLSEDNAPAWVQAVGSIVAIFTAIGVALWERVASRNSERRKERADFLIERKKCSFLISALGGVVVAMGNRFQPGKGESLWDARMARIYVHSELERSKDISIHALTKLEMECVYELRLIAMQIMEALIDAESSSFTNDKKEQIVEEVEFQFLLKVIADNIDNAKTAVDNLKSNWKENNESV